jgi:hypothetical protein
MKSISLAEVVTSIAAFVPISEMWQKSAEQHEKQSPENAQQKPIVIDLIETFRSSGAAIEFASYLREAQLEARPRWHSPPIKDVQLQDENALTLLDLISLHYSQFAKICEKLSMGLHDQHVRMRAYVREERIRADHWQLAEKVRVDRGDVIQFLDHYDIPHTLDGRSGAAAGRSAVDDLIDSRESPADDAFVSLYKVIEAISPRIQVDEQEIRDYSSNIYTVRSLGAAPGAANKDGSPEESTDTSFGFDLQRILGAPVQRIFQGSRSASGLLRIFGSGNVRDLPKWRELTYSGVAIYRAKLEEDGMHELRSLSELELRYKEEFRNFDKISSRYRTEPDSGEQALKPPALDLPTQARSYAIGFIRSEIIPFLNDHEIPHNLGTVGEPSMAEKLLAGPGQRPLTTQELAAAFADIDGCTRKTGRDHKGWLSYLQGSLPKWAKVSTIQLSIGKPGKLPSTWDPVEFAKKAVLSSPSKRPFFGQAFDERFDGSPQLAQWKDDWHSWRYEVREYDR